MKYLIVLFLLSPLFLISRNTFAMAPKIDSVYADSIYAVNAITDAQSKASLGKPDSNLVTFGNAALLDLMFRNHAHTKSILIKANTTLLIWGKKDNTVDSSAGQVVLYKIADDGSIEYNSAKFILGDGLNTIIVPNQDFSYIELSLADPGPVKHAQSYLFDAVALLQDTTSSSAVSSQSSPVNLISSYPNPFVGTTTIHFELKDAGEIELSVIDALGRETDRITPVFLESGIHEIPLALRTPGFYFVRLFVNGQPLGNPLKITSR